MKIELICVVIAFLVGASLAAATPTKPSELFWCLYDSHRQSHS